MSDQPPEHLRISENQVNALRAELGEEQIMQLCRMAAASCTYPQFIGEAINISTLCVTHGSAGSAVVVTMSARAWELVKRLMRDHGKVTEL